MKRLNRFHCRPIPLFLWRVKCLLVTFFTASSELTKQGGTELALDQPSASSRIASFDWDSLVESCLPSNAPFQIKVKVEPYTIARCIVDEGASVSILSARAWQGMGSPSLVSKI